jgi:hypothetical protein
MIPRKGIVTKRQFVAVGYKGTTRYNQFSNGNL